MLLDGILLIGFALSHFRVFVVVMNEDGVDYGNKQSGIVEMPCNRFIVVTCVLHDNLCLTGKAFQKTCPVL